MAKERGTPRYLKIAQDICGKIMNGEYPEGTLLKGRSILGAAYGVSPETVRKALNLLEKEKVVSSKRGYSTRKRLWMPRLTMLSMI